MREFLQWASENYVIVVAFLWVFFPGAEARICIWGEISFRRRSHK